MEAMKMMKLFAVMSVMMMAVSAVSAMDAPAPSPVSDATMAFVPTTIVALSAIACSRSKTENVQNSKLASLGLPKPRGAKRPR
ncbi:hypothetical protein Tco_1031998 [Tanacetum coccineum]|uniref:Uncharacterized protein n=1 Tax=Tanacetum coccineum TaxID=301880 RepID=A0ABQ5GCW1_9ASTR